GLNGDFTANGGTIYDNLSTADASQGIFQVTGNVTFNQQCTFRSRDVAPQAGTSVTWGPLTWGGTLTGRPTVVVPDGWGIDWDTASKTLLLTERSEEHTSE